MKDILLVFLFYSVMSLETGRQGLSRTVVSNITQNHVVPPDFPSVCPYNRYCQSTPLKDNTDGNLASCCEKCSCDLNCYEIGNCCPDAPFVPPGKVKYPCTNLDSDDKYDIWFHVIDDCTDPLKALTNSRCYLPTELSDLVAVSNPESGRVYKNKHCAICNNIQDYVTWTLHVGCEDLLQMSFRTEEESHDYIFQNRYNCSVFSVPPGNRVGEMSRCFPDDVIRSKCNVTGYWDVYDEGVEEACHENRDGQNVVFNDPVFASFIHYANVYCYMCNQPMRTEFEHLCDSDYLYLGNNFVRSFTAILDIQSIDGDDVTEYQCKKEELFDPFTKLCRPFTCPGGTIPRHGHCKNIVVYSEGYKVIVYFEVTVENQNGTVVYKTLLELLERRFSQMFGSGCGISETLLFRLVNMGVLLLRMDIYSTKACAAETLLMNIYRLAMNDGTRLKYKNRTNEKLIVGLKVGFSDYSAGKMEVLAVKRRVLKYLTRRNLIDDSILCYCPSVELTIDEVYTLGLDTSCRRNTTYLDPEYTGNAERKLVCVETYFEARELLSRSVSSSNSHRLTSLCWFYLFVLLMMY